MARTYRAIVVNETKGKADTYATYEVRAKGQSKARRAVLLGAMDQTPTGTKVGIVAISRLKDGKPVDDNVDQLGSKSDMLVVLGDPRDYNPGTHEDVAAAVKKAMTVVPEPDTPPDDDEPEGVCKAGAGKPWLSAILTDEIIVEELAEFKTVYEYNFDNERRLK